jgi:predicted RNA-binding Zn ribbon-like protein
MVFTPETVRALETVVLAVNNASKPDALPALGVLFADHQREGNFEQGSHPVDELESVRRTLPLLREILSAKRDSAVGLVNSVLAASQARPRLVRDQTHGWRVHVADESAALASRILVETAIAMMEVITTDQLGRLGTCDAAGCDGVVLDLTRNRSRRYCSVACGNREDVAAYRVRQRADSLSR